MVALCKIHPIMGASCRQRTFRSNQPSTLGDKCIHRLRQQHHLQSANLASWTVDKEWNCLLKPVYPWWGVMPGRLFQICRCDCGTVPKNLRNATSSDRAAKSQPLRLKFKRMQCQLAIVPGKMPWKSFWSLSISTFATMVALIPNAFFAASWPGDGLFFLCGRKSPRNHKIPEI